MNPKIPGYALVTGASSGIGAALAREYARRGVRLILTARRAERLQALADDLRPQVDVVVIAADLADPGAPAALQAEIAARGLHVAHLDATSPQTGKRTPTRCR